MICPSCGRHVPDDALVCPGCHAPLDVTRKLSLSDARWCPVCGALAAPGAEVCPKCGTPLAEEKGPERRQRDIDLPEIGNTGMMDALGETGVMAGVESAIPPEDGVELGGQRADRMPRQRSVLLAVLLAVLVVGGAALLITHPWNPEATRISATTPADTSMQGFPGFLDSLSGQDTSVGSGEKPLSAADALAQCHDELGSLSDRADKSEELLRSAGVSDDTPLSERKEALGEAQEISVEVSNVISEIRQLDDGSNSDSVSELVTIASWLRNRCDALTASWERSVSAESPSDEADDILSEVNEARAYAWRFTESFDQWEAV